VQSENADSGCSVVELQRKNQSLEIDVAVLRQKLVETAAATMMQPPDAVVRLISTASKIAGSGGCEEIAAGTDQTNSGKLTSCYDIHRVTHTHTHTHTHTRLAAWRSG